MQQTRRQFLKSLASLAGVTALPGLPSLGTDTWPEMTPELVEAVSRPSLMMLDNFGYRVDTIYWGDFVIPVMQASISTHWDDPFVGLVEDIPPGPLYVKQRSWEMDAGGWYSAPRQKLGRHPTVDDLGGPRSFGYRPRGQPAPYTFIGEAFLVGMETQPMPMSRQRDDDWSLARYNFQGAGPLSLVCDKENQNAHTHQP